jgi:hypothetical protein
MIRKCVAGVWSRFVAATALAALGAVCLTPSTAGAGGPAGEKAARARALIRLVVQEEIDMKDFQVPMKLKEALGQLMEQMQTRGKAVPILVNTDAFRMADPDAPDIYDVDVKFPPFPRKMALRTALRVMLGQVPGQNARATFVVLPSHVEITTTTATSQPEKLRQEVLATIDKQPLQDALEDLAAAAGVSVAVDPRVGDKARTLVSGTFANDATLSSAMCILADMAGLRVVEAAGGVYVTTPENAKTMREEMRKRPAHKPKTPPPPLGAGYKSPAGSKRTAVQKWFGELASRRVYPAGLAPAVCLAGSCHRVLAQT